MHETYLNNEREFEEKFGKLIKKIDSYYGDGSELNLHSSLLSHNRTSLIKIMKALEKELEINQEDARKYPLITDGKQDDRYNAGYENALQLAINKIENFIKKIQ